MAERVRVGIIGAGSIVRHRHLPGLRSVPEVEVRVVCNRTRATAEAIAAEFGVPEVETEWRRVLERGDIDAVFIGTPPYLHAEASIAALDAGKHVFCQARMARDTAEARRMLERARRSDRVTMLCPPPNGMYGDRVMRRLIGDGYLGALRDVHATGFTESYADASAPLHWRQDFDLSGYNLLTLGMWIEVIHRWAGFHRTVAAATRVHTSTRVRADGTSVPVRHADSVAISAELESGAVGSYHFSGVARFAPSSVIQLFGSEGTLLYDLGSDEIRGARAGDAEARLIPVPPDEARPWTVESDFISAIRDGTPAEPSFHDGLKYMEFTEAVWHAAASGQRVVLPPSA